MCLRLTYKLRTIDNWIKDSSVPSDERKAFFINLYNCLMIDALVECSLHSEDDGQERKLPVSPLKVNTVNSSILTFSSFSPAIIHLIMIYYIYSKAFQEGGGNIWKSSAYNIGGFIVTLDDIEHGILRGNRPHPSSKSKTHFLPGNLNLYDN